MSEPTTTISPHFKQENERKFRLMNEDWRRVAPDAVYDITQGYFSYGRVSLQVLEEYACIYIKPDEHTPSTKPLCFTIPYDQVKHIKDCFDKNGDAIKGTVVRIRTSVEHSSGKKLAFLTIKGPRNIVHEHGVDVISRGEFEEEIDFAKAQESIRDLCNHKIEKVRHKITHKGQVWDVDEFTEKRHRTLVLAEIEMPDTHTIPFAPPWIKGAWDVSADKRYTNNYLAKRKNEPFDYIGDRDFSKETHAVEIVKGKIQLDPQTFELVHTPTQENYLAQTEVRPSCNIP